MVEAVVGSRRAAQAGLLAFAVAKMESVPIEGDRRLTREAGVESASHLPGR